MNIYNTSIVATLEEEAFLMLATVRESEHKPTHNVRENSKIAIINKLVLSGTWPRVPSNYSLLWTFVENHSKIGNSWGVRARLDV